MKEESLLNNKKKKKPEWCIDEEIVKNCIA